MQIINFYSKNKRASEACVCVCVCVCRERERESFGKVLLHLLYAMN